MPHRPRAEARRSLALDVVEPYDFELSLRLVRSFPSAAPREGDRLRLAARIDGRPALIEIRRGPAPRRRLLASASPAATPRRLRPLAEWVLNAGLDLAPFYRRLRRDRSLAPLARKFRGLKPMRPASLFEMAVIAVTEQQISMAAAVKIRERLVRRFGDPVDGIRAFPTPGALAAASPRALRACGLSHAKTRAIRELAAKIARGEFDLGALETMSDDEARDAIIRLRGFGPWSADYILIRGLARPDAVPFDDLGVRRIVGESLGTGRRASPSEVAELLEPYRPFRGLTVFYLLAEHMLKAPAGAPPAAVGPGRDPVIGRTSIRAADRARAR
jgi:DNA-3-methyladenine glycosylase II